MTNAMKGEAGMMRWRSSFVGLVIFVVFFSNGNCESFLVIQDNIDSEDCRVMQFKHPIINRILLGHVIKSVRVKSETGCEANCFEDDDCMSVNFGPLQEDGKHLCELSSSDYDIHPDDLKNKDEVIFKDVWNYCSNDSCPSGHKCQTGFTGKGYRCIASNKTAGETGNITTDVDECVTGTHDCDLNADCVNTPGSFQCSCKEGFMGNGRSCLVSISFSSSSYAVSDEQVTWEVALSSCREFGAELAKIESQRVNDFIDATLLESRKKTWIGLNDIDTEGVFEWSDGTRLQEYSNWGYNEPNNNNDVQHCVIIGNGIFAVDYFNAEWLDQRCHNLNYYLCEKTVI